MATDNNEQQPQPELPNPSPAELLGAFTETAMLVSTLEQNTQNFHSQMVIKGIVAELVNKVETIKKEFGVDGGVAVVQNDTTPVLSDEIRKIADSIDIDFFTADLMLMKEVSRVADEVCQKYDQIDVLINNVGAYFAFRDVTEEGFERTFALNHLGYFLMTKNLVFQLHKIYE